MTNNADTITKQISNLTSILIETGACVSQNFPSNKNGYVSFKGNDKVSVALKSLPYTTLYSELLKDKCYNMKLLDGALVQLMYKFTHNQIEAHRLSFFPSPFLEDYQTAFETYENDELYGDVVRETITPFPIRFDFSDDNSTHKNIYHSKAHLTLGEFCHCRIPVSAPLLPVDFISFIMRHFYFEDRNKVINEKIYTIPKSSFPITITNEEKAVLHLNV